MKRSTGYGPRSAVLVTLAIYFGSQILAGFLVAGYLYLVADNSPEAILRLLESSTAAQFSFILIVELLSLAFLWQFIKFRKITLPEIGIKNQSSRICFTQFRLTRFISLSCWELLY